MLLFISMFFYVGVFSQAQPDSFKKKAERSNPKKIDTTGKKRRTDTGKLKIQQPKQFQRITNNRADSLFADSISKSRNFLVRDSIKRRSPVTAKIKPVAKQDILNKDTILINSLPQPATQSDTLSQVIKFSKTIPTDPLTGNTFIKITGKPEFILNKSHYTEGKESIFYLMVGFLLLVSLMKSFYSTYFNNIFKVFFNTSLRQNQLTDIIVQARLSSLIFNIIFLLSAGMYIWLLAHHYKIVSNLNFSFLLICIGLVTGIYIIKYVAVKFLGWISGVSGSADQYIFIIFLINKVLGILLIPFVILLAFAPPAWAANVIVLSWLIIITLFIMRYLRTYSLLSNKLSLSRFHFFVYLTAVEIIPLLILFSFVIRHIDTGNFVL